MQSNFRILALGWLCLFWSNVALAQTGTPGDTPTLTPSRFVGTQQVTAAPDLSITSPVPGQVLQGSVTIVGYSALPGFVFAQLAFAYAENPTGTWFQIADSGEPVAGGALAQWDTSAITDGDYTLRLTVRFEDGSQREIVVAGLRVRNYTPVETDTPTPVTPTTTLVPGGVPVTATLTRTARASATPLPTNPAEITTQNLATSLGKGALAVLGFFAFMGAYLLVRKIRERD
jgi:hypothetical protein